MIVTNATNACPIVITTDVPHCVPLLPKTKIVTIAGVLGNTAANGTWVATYVSPTTFFLCGSNGNGAFTSSPGSSVICSLGNNGFVGAGGAVAGGAATLDFARQFAMTASGGAVAGGAATLNFGHHFTLTGSGGAVGGGAATITALTIYVYDTFTGSNGTNPESRSPDFGSAPTSTLNNYEIQSNRAKNPHAQTNFYDTLVYESSHADCTITADLNSRHIDALAVPGYDGGNIIFRWGDDNNFWIVQPYNGTIVLANRVAGGGFTAVVTSGAVTLSNDVTYSLKVVLLGTSIKIYVNGVQVISTTSSTFQSNTKHGLSLYSALTTAPGVPDPTTPGDSWADNFLVTS